MSNWLLGKKLNYVKDVFIDGCDAPLTAWFEAALPATLHAAMSWYCIDPIEVFTGWVRPGGLPKGTRGGSHARGAQKGRKGRGLGGKLRAGFGFDPNEWLAKKMPFAQDLEGRRVPNGANWMWSGFGVIQRFQNIMFMYSVAEDFFYETSLGVARTEYCQQQRASVFLGTTEVDGHFGILGYTAAVIAEVQKSRFITFGGGNGLICPNPNFRAMFSYGSARTWEDEPIPAGLGMLVQPHGQPETYSACPAGGGSGMCETISYDPGFVAFAWVGPFSANFKNIEFLVFGKRREPSFRPPGWCNEKLEDAINWSEEI